MTDTITQWQIENLEALRIQAALAGPSLAAMQAYINGLEFELRSALARQPDCATNGVCVKSGLYCPTAQQVAQGWRPIETAPHNSNPVLALSESGSIRSATGYWLVNLLHASKVDGDNCNYTHWMPLTAEPKGGVA